VFADSDACVAPVLTLAEAPDHPHNAARASYVDVAGATLAAPAPRFARTPSAPGEPPAAGADTAALLAELGYDEDARAELRTAGAIS